nr:acetolactate synthase large subunit [Fodinicola feengrottensis]
MGLRSQRHSQSGYSAGFPGRQRMNGAQALIRTLVDSGVDVCFSNPGTSEMHFVAALDSVPEMHGVLALFEGVATGAADGYARMADKPAGVLLHFGPRSGKRARQPAQRAARGDPRREHRWRSALDHKRYDAPLESDIDAIASAVSNWQRRSEKTTDVGRDAADAVAAACSPPGGVATLILPADVSWSEGGQAADPVRPQERTPVAEEAVIDAVNALTSGERTVILLGGAATREPALVAASRISAASGAIVLAETFPARITRGAGVPTFDRLGYLAEQVAYQLEGVQHLILAGARSPVSFFAYPGKASDLVPDGCAVHTLAGASEDAAGALERLAEVIGKDAEPVLAAAHRPELPTGPLTAQNWPDVIGALLPENAIVADEANTSGVLIPSATAGSPKHDVLTLTGGAIGYGLPVATGAALACPDRPVLCLQADGSAMYTISALWTHARENLNITTVLLNNSAYAILRLELQRVGAQAGGPRAKDLLDLSRPDLDFVSIAQGMGVPASKATTAEELAEALKAAFAEPGPHLIEAIVPAMIP